MLSVIVRLYPYLSLPVLSVVILICLICFLLIYRLHDEFGYRSLFNSRPRVLFSIFPPLKAGSRRPVVMGTLSRTLAASCLPNYRYIGTSRMTLPEKALNCSYRTAQSGSKRAQAQA